MSATLFTNAKVIDGSGEAAFQGDVLVEGNRIKTVAREVGSVSADGAEVVDCAGATLTYTSPATGRARLWSRRFHRPMSSCFQAAPTRSVW